MPLPTRLHEKYLGRFDELIAEGDAIRCSTRTVVVEDELYAAGLSSAPTTYEEVDSGRFHEWQVNWATLLSQIVPPNHPKASDIRQMSSYGPSALGEMLAVLKAIKKDYVSGFLDDLSMLIRAEVAGDYMAQAEVLLVEDYYVPAAVLAGAVLEDALRKLCDGKGIPTSKPNGERKTINPMNDELAKAGAYNAAKAHEIRAWADIRNDCAHGDGGKVKPEDVQRMIQGVHAFVADYLK